MGYPLVEKLEIYNLLPFQHNYRSRKIIRYLVFRNLSIHNMKGILMKKMKAMKLTVLLLGVALLSGGCVGRAIKEGVGSVTGAKGVYMQIQSPGSLESYTSFEVGGFDDRFGRTPSQLLQLIPREIRKRLAESNLTMGGSGKTLLIQGEVIYFEKAGAMGQAFGPLEEAVCEIKLVDKATGQEIGAATCVGRSTETVNQGLEKKAEGIAKAVVDWIQSNRPKN